ncbi:MAG: hypothetical protein Sapg2KO_26230 [Saprospiraceae bacterium]
MLFKYVPNSLKEKLLVIQNLNPLPMKNLKVIVDFVNKHKTKPLQNTVFKENSKTLELYHAISEDRFPSETAAKRYFYPGAPRQLEYFSQLKRSLTERVIDMILLIDFSKSPYETPAKGYNYCAKNVVILNIFYSNTLTSVYLVKMAEKTLQIALFHGFPDMILACSRFCLHYYLQTDQKTRAKRFKMIVDQYLEALKDEIDLEYEDSSYRSKEIVTKKKPSEEAITIGLKKATWAKVIMKKHEDSQRVHIRATILLHKIYSYLALHDELVKTCRHSIQLIKEDPSRFTVPFINITYGTCLRNLIKLGGYGEAFQLYEERHSYFIEGSRNWYSLHLYYSILNIHAGKYQTAFDIYKKAFSFKKLFFKQTKTMQEQWHIFEGYMHILIKAGLIPDPSDAPDFKISKLDKKVTILRRDTGGYGISIRVVEIMHGLLDKDYPTLLDKEEALKVYMKRYLVNDFTYRVSCLIKMLITIIRCNFHPVRSKAHIKDKKLFSKLKKVPFKEAYQPDDLEIIPLGILWDIALDSL